MKNHTYKITLQERSEAEAEQKVAALTTLAQKLTASELVKLAHIVKNDPVKTALAKQYLGV